MLFLVVLCFGLSWLPYIINKLFNIFPPRKNFEIPNVFVFVGNFLGLLNSCINPILYAVLNRNFSKAFKNALRCRWNYGVEERRRRVSEPQIFNGRPSTPCQEGRERRLSSLSSVHTTYAVELLSSLKASPPESVRVVCFRKLGMYTVPAIQSCKSSTRRVSFGDAADVTQTTSKNETAGKVTTLENIIE